MVNFGTFYLICCNFIRERFGHNATKDASRLVHAPQETIDWERMTFYVFDLLESANINTNSKSYAQRYTMLQNMGSKNHPFLRVAPTTVCDSSEHAEEVYHLLLYIKVVHLNKTTIIGIKSIFCKFPMSKDGRLCPGFY